MAYRGQIVVAVICLVVFKALRWSALLREFPVRLSGWPDLGRWRLLRVDGLRAGQIAQGASGDFGPTDISRVGCVGQGIKDAGRYAHKLMARM